MQRPWFGNAALDAGDRARGDLPWRTVAPSAIAMDEGWLTPHALDVAELADLREQWRLATLRAVDAGFDFLEVHCAHGYLLHEFLSPLSNRRNDGYGGDRAGRMRYPLEIIETVRAAWPADKPLFGAHLLGRRRRRRAGTRRPGRLRASRPRRAAPI